MADYYTFQIHYGPSDKPLVFEAKDLFPGTQDFIYWSRDLRSKLFTTGFMIQSTEICWEFISPFRIHTAYLIKQEGKFGI
jgi:hypothetical protein